MDDYKDFRILLRSVDRYYEDFEHAVISYLKMPGNSYKKKSIEEYIVQNPRAYSSDVLEYMIDETGFWDTYAEYLSLQKDKKIAAV